MNKKNLQTKKQVHIKSADRKKRLVMSLAVCVLLFGLTGFAWYSFQTRKDAESENREVMVPYYLYLLDDSESASFQLAVGNLHPSETKSVIVGVSNKAEGQEGVSYPIGRNSEFAYELELAYTQNLPMDYQVYELKEVDASGVQAGDPSVIEITDETGSILRYLKPVIQGGQVKPLAVSGESASITEKNNKEMYGEGASKDTVVNYVQYDVYQKDAGGTALSLETKSTDGRADYDLDYYMIELKWQDGIEFDNYLKETDLVYVIVKALQPEPEAQ